MEAALLKSKAAAAHASAESLQAQENELARREEEWKKTCKKQQDDLDIAQSRLTAREEQMCS